MTRKQIQMTKHEMISLSIGDTMRVKQTFEEILDSHSQATFCMHCFARKKFDEPQCCPDNAFIPLENFEHEFQMEIAKRLYDAQ